MNAPPQPRDSAKPKVGVVLGSGGIKTLAAIPLFNLFEQHNIEIDLLVGCSGGALLASLIGCNYSTDDIRALIETFLNRKLFSKINMRTFLGMLKLPMGDFNNASSLLKPDALRSLYRQLFQDRRLENLHPATVLHATDLETGEGVLLSSGLLADAVYASTAYYPYLSPLQVNNKWLVDGAFSASLPLMEAVKKNMDIIISVSVECRPIEKPKNLLQNYNYLLEKMKTSYERSQVPLAIDFHHHEIVFVNIIFDRIIEMWEVDQIPAILEKGHQTVTVKQEEILSVINSFSGLHNA